MSDSISGQIIAELLSERTGQQLTESRQWRIGTALSGIYRELGVSNVDALVCLLDGPDGSRLTQRVVEALLNNETYFFRDRQLFDVLTRQVLPDLAEKRKSTKRLSIWSAGCSTGQEVFSLAMLFAEQPARWQDWTIEILGTDVSAKVIEAARDACYSQFEIQRGLGVSQMLSFFDETIKGWRPNAKLQRMVQFEQHNLLDPQPHACRFDLVLCRNVLLYFSAETRRVAFGRIHTVLAEDGWMMLGAGETVIGQTESFRPAPGKQNFYEPV
jgi:chemotaxis protein methyltransferase CheR